MIHAGNEGFEEQLFAVYTLMAALRTDLLGKQGFVGLAVDGVKVGEWVGVAVGAIVEGVAVGERVGEASIIHALVICPAYAAKQQPRWVV